jgi:hypothetical protein
VYCDILVNFVLLRGKEMDVQAGCGTLMLKAVLTLLKVVPIALTCLSR